MNACRVPVVLFVFNRPGKLRRLLSVLAEVRPTALLVIADGPRVGHPEDIIRCREVRELIARVDWPCEIVRNYADVNLGCDPRVESGLDWAFAQVDEAILLEDDLNPDPSFFRWCAEMLSRYRDVPSVVQISGRNELGRWDGDGGDHHLVWHGLQLGWATWRRAWRAARAVVLPGEQSILNRHLARWGVDPLVAEHYQLRLMSAAAGGQNAWDERWSLQLALIGGLTVVSPVNLVAHEGFDEEATHSRNPADMRCLVPVGQAPTPSIGTKLKLDNRLDRWSILLLLMRGFHDPVMLRRLFRAPSLVSRLRYRLRPFNTPAESLSALQHLRNVASHPGNLDRLIEVMEAAIRDQVDER